MKNHVVAQTAYAGSRLDRSQARAAQDSVIDDQSTGRIVLSEIMRSLDASLEVATFADPWRPSNTRAASRRHGLTDYKMPSLDGIRGHPAVAPHFRLRGRSDRVHHGGQPIARSATVPWRRGRPIS